MISIDCNLSTAFSQLDGIQERVSEALRPAVYRAARMVYLEAQNRAPVSEQGHWFYSRRKKDGTAGKKYWFASGSLKKSIYIKHADDKSVQGLRETYVIAWRKNSSALGYVPYAHMVEYGTARTAPAPFVRPAYDAKKKQAEQLIIDVIQRAVAQND
ncbi:HK97 gp10 family phage protein [Wielerella bovis]|uniref:HK97-gp10 family putative phage morphogenesis protein n=1 Tax=Wielerella bovis TaxID=2917790 RepID=UPI0020199E2C|nr:HK97-gp10 family putative phage morphogenesis protein [Wielerella bovis]ULJ64182.1 HK97 gp10 family phage protein [Wielerella bovis]